MDTKPQPTCLLCGQEGEALYSDLQDRLFGAAGLWNTRRCPNKYCGLIWLDPMPVASELWKAYGTYYTHNVRDKTARVDFLRQIYRGVRRRQWLKKVQLVYGTAQGVLLDVGCGSGEGLASFRELGWQVQGLDFDENAVNTARKLGLDIRCGALEEQAFPEATFDVVNLSHVVEHLPNPIRTLVECRRILKPGGRLVVFTPNSACLGHRLFGRHWRGLEPPRHLHVFSMNSMRLALAAAGFCQVRVHSQAALSLHYESILLRVAPGAPIVRSHRNWAAWALGQLLTTLEVCVQKWKPEISGCLAAVAIKE